MALKIIMVMVAVTLLSSASGRMISQNAVASVLQEILSPGNTDKALQLIKHAASRSNKKVAIPEMARALACGEMDMPARTYVANDYFPVRTIANDYLPVRTMANDYLPARTIANDYLPVRTIANDYLPARAVNELPVRIIANDGYRPYPEIQKMARPVPVQQVVQTNMLDSLVMPKEIFQPFSVGEPQERVRPCQTLPPGSNPYLPIASPVSAMSPGSLPPPTQSKGHFLRKIPIPPPTL